MVLYSFHYAVTTFFLTTWTRHFSWVMLAYFVFQTIFFFAAAIPPADHTLFWFWQTLVAGLGAIAGLFVSPQRAILIEENPWSWFYLILSLAAFLGAQLLYAFYPPFPGIPAGQAGVGLAATLVLTLIIIFMVWYGNSREHKPWRHYLWWAFLFGVLELLFYISLTGFAEVYVAMIACGAVIVLGMLGNCFCAIQVRNTIPLHHRYTHGR